MKRPRNKPLPATARLWRVYYTCRDAYPYLAAIDEGTIATQRSFKHVSAIEGGFTSNSDIGQSGPEMVKTGLRTIIPRSQRRDRANEPTWWLEVYGIAEEVKDGVAIH